ncbi:MAG: radical SAM family heme chaperone HemW [Saprospiraceae bacterium]
MSGIYIHIPFCKQACHYCNFHFSTSLKYRADVVTAIVQEIAQRHDYLEDKQISSVYFGGGTPSLLTTDELQSIFTQLHHYFQIAPNAEITLEANPDDLNLASLTALKATPINRLSIGIQSFTEEDLQFMNRAHSAQEAEVCIELARQAGFDKLSIDLIYGTPTLTDAQWESNLARVFAQRVPHISCYCLTVEPNTALDHFVKTGKAAPVDEEKSTRHFEILLRAMEAHGYVQYEISNFALPDHYAQHNSNYWLNVPYLGLGPSAHSFDGNSRQWNIANNAKYRKAIQHPGKNQLFEREVLQAADRYNEYILTSLRTIWGCRLVTIQNIDFKFATYFLEKIKSYLDQALILEEDDTYRLSTSGKLLADRIAMELFWEEA